MTPAAHPAVVRADVPALVAAAKRAYTTRLVDLGRAVGMVSDPAARPDIGDVVLARVVQLGQHRRIELPAGRRATLYPDDLVVVCYGARYAPDQFLAAVPDDLGPCHLVAAGGVAGRVEAAHAAVAEATSIAPLGILADDAGRRINLRDSMLDPLASLSSHRAPTIAVTGSAMNVGKTTAGASLVHGLRAAGRRVGAAKVTGTGAGGDVWLYADSGADPVYDFVDAGVPSTRGLGPDRVRAVFHALTTRLAADGTDVNVIEVADGLHHAETATLLADPLFAERVDGVVFATRDSLAVPTGVAWLREAGLPLLSVSGLISASPLAMAEAAGSLGELPVDTAETLRDPRRAVELLDAALAARAGALPADLTALRPAGEVGRR